MAAPVPSTPPRTSHPVSQCPDAPLRPVLGPSAFERVRGDTVTMPPGVWAVGDLTAIAPNLVDQTDPIYLMVKTRGMSLLIRHKHVDMVITCAERVGTPDSPFRDQDGVAFYGWTVGAVRVTPGVAIDTEKVARYIDASESGLIVSSQEYHGNLMAVFKGDQTFTVVNTSASL